MIHLLLIAAMARPFPLNEAWQPPLHRWEARGFSIHGRFATVGLYYNDSDFDDAARFYDPSGPSQGQIATLFRPGVTITPHEDAQIYYQAELGWDVWSRDDADEGGLRVHHREIWTRWRLGDRDGLTVGYQRVSDPSGLLLDHRAGAAQLKLGWRRGHQLTLLGAVTPDDVEEGLREDNFKHDSALGGAAFVYRAGELLFDLAGYGLWDRRLEGRPLSLGVAVLGLRERKGDLWAHVMLQRGGWEAAGLGGEEVTISAWATQLGAAWQLGRFSLLLNALATSPDDAYDGNAHSGAPLLSGRDASSTLMLSEDEYWDRRRNLNERMSARLGSFYQSRAGLALVDMTLGYAFDDDYVMSLIAGGAVVLEPENALGARLIGAELGWVHELHFYDTAGIYLMGQLLIPGGAAAAYVNDVDRAATRLMYGGQLGLVSYF